MMKDEDLLALTDAVLDGPNPNWAELVRQIRNEWALGLREGIGFARIALKQSKHPKAKELLERLP
jgi:hypothetical protein